MVVWTDYMRYRAEPRGFDVAEIERILRLSPERYLDQATGRRIAVGHHAGSLVLIPYDLSEEQMIPVTVHRTNRQQINARLKAGRYALE
jgi:sigma54-dependent transcription regulator